MSDILKCPFCGSVLEQTSIYKLNSYACTDLTCKGYYMTATKDMWQELIRTRKALELAVNALKEINDRYEAEEQRGREEDDSPDWWDFAMDTGEILTKALEQITAEQKDK